MLGNVVPLWEIDARRDEARRGGHPGDHAADAGRPARPLRARRVRHVVTAAGRRAEVRRLAGDVHAHRGRRRAAGWHRYADALTRAGATSRPTARRAATDPLLLYFTSGTTAKPKLVLHTHQSYPVGHLSTMYWIGLQPGDVHLNISSPGWAKHAWSCFFAPWNAGADGVHLQPAALRRARPARRAGARTA